MYRYGIRMLLYGSPIFISKTIDVFSSNAAYDFISFNQLSIIFSRSNSIPNLYSWNEKAGWHKRSYVFFHLWSTDSIRIGSRHSGRNPDCSTSTKWLLSAQCLIVWRRTFSKSFEYVVSKKIGRIWSNFGIHTKIKWVSVECVALYLCCSLSVDRFILRMQETY
jgi:hypothetical protein